MVEAPDELLRLITWINFFEKYVLDKEIISSRNGVDLIKISCFFFSFRVNNRILGKMVEAPGESHYISGFIKSVTANFKRRAGSIISSIVFARFSSH